MNIFNSLLLAVALSLAAGCGGNVVVDADVTTTTTGPVDRTCVELCEQSPPECMSGSDCATQCSMIDKIANELCHDSYQAFLDCALEDPAAQCQGEICSQEATTFSLCLAKVCDNDPQACVF
jgi:hypothetical protein